MHGQDGSGSAFCDLMNIEGASYQARNSDITDIVYFVSIYSTDLVANPLAGHSSPDPTAAAKSSAQLNPELFRKVGSR